MKKLFAAVIASVAFMFGLASCQNEEVSLAELAYNSKSEQATVYTVTFNANGGSLTKKRQNVEENVATALTSVSALGATYSDHTFLYWNTESDGSGDSYADGETISLTQNLTLYAQWFSNSNIYSFHSSVTNLASGTDGQMGTSASYCYFGDWPQTIKANNVSIYEKATVIMGGFTYYLGDDGNYYAKCTENAYNSGYTYSDGTEVAQRSASSEKYFKVEPIKWCVLTNDYDGKKLLLAENILTANVPYYGSLSDRSLNDGTTIYPNNYKYSNIRAFLNGTANQKGFLQSAFTSSAQSLIATTSVDNSAASTTDSGSNLTQATSYACEDTSDKIFLLSEKEATTASYGFDSYSSSGIGNTRIRVTTDYAKANNAYTSSGYGGYWWLRSPYYGARYNARYVLSSGNTSYGLDVRRTYVGVVPALCLE
ncbi:MAG: InlB B-repeat-containing protein [Treponema sp.]|nr:InlB B-repeat-containing protein [Treponema sp.]